MKNKNSFSVAPPVFSNPIGLSELNLETVTDDTQAATEASAPPESARGVEVTDENKEKSMKMMGRIFARKKREDTEEVPSGAKKITLRKNSMRRKIAATEKILNRSPAPKPAGSKEHGVRVGMPPKPNSRLPPKSSKEA